MHRPHVNLRTLATATAAALISLSACGSDDVATQPSSTLPQTQTTVESPTPLTQPPATENIPVTEPDSATADSAGEEERTITVRARRQAMADAALLQPTNLGDDWQDLGAANAFPMTAELAATVPTCKSFVDVVFDGNDGVWAHTALGRNADIAFTSLTVFATTDEAAAMVAATATPEFDQCWADFNDVAVLELPFGIQSAHYESVDPPELELGGDSATVHALDGTIELGTTEMPDTCVCVFAQRGRTVVAFHSAAPVFSPAERSALITAALARVDESVE